MSPPRPPAPSRPDRPLRIALDEPGAAAHELRDPDPSPQLDRRTHESGEELSAAENVVVILRMVGEHTRALATLEERFTSHAQDDRAALGELRDIGLRTEATVELVRATVASMRRDLDATTRTAEDAQRTADKADTALAVQGQRAANALLEAGEKVAADVVAARGDRRKIVAAVLGGGGVITLLIELARALLLRGG